MRDSELDSIVSPEGGDFPRKPRQKSSGENKTTSEIIPEEKLVYQAYIHWQREEKQYQDRLNDLERELKNLEQELTQKSGQEKEETEKKIKELQTIKKRTEELVRKMKRNQEDTLQEARVLAEREGKMKDIEDRAKNEYDIFLKELQQSFKKQGKEMRIWKINQRDQFIKEYVEKKKAEMKIEAKINEYCQNNEIKRDFVESTFKNLAGIGRLFFDQEFAKKFLDQRLAEKITKAEMEDIWMHIMEEGFGKDFLMDIVKKFEILKQEPRKISWWERLFKRKQLKEYEEERNKAKKTLTELTYGIKRKLEERLKKIEEFKQKAEEQWKDMLELAEKNVGSLRDYYFHDWFSGGEYSKKHPKPTPEIPGHTITPTEKPQLSQVREIEKTELERIENDWGQLIERYEALRQQKIGGKKVEESEINEIKEQATIIEQNLQNFKKQFAGQADENRIKILSNLIEILKRDIPRELEKDKGQRQQTIKPTENLKQKSEQEIKLMFQELDKMRSELEELRNFLKEKQTIISQEVQEEGLSILRKSENKINSWRKKIKKIINDLALKGVRVDNNPEIKSVENTLEEVEELLKDLKGEDKKSNKN